MYASSRNPYLSTSSLPSAKTEYSVDYDKLDGDLNLWNLDYRMGRNESPEMENLWWRDGVLWKECGYKGIAYAPDNKYMGKYEER